VYTDMTVSLSKSISVFHASIRENQHRARLAGDQAGAAWWARIEQRYQEVLPARSASRTRPERACAGTSSESCANADVDHGCPFVACAGRRPVEADLPEVEAATECLSDGGLAGVGGAAC
jgi:hypothetical protein